MSSSSIFITGDTGFIGRNLLEVGFPGFDVFNSKDYLEDLLIVNDVNMVLGNIKPDYIIHMAGMSSPNMNVDTTVVENNMKITQNLINASPNSKFIFFSTTLIYDENDEDKPKSMYGLSKLMCENLFRIQGIQALHLRLGAVVGPNLTHGFVKDFVKKLEEKKEVLDVYGKSPGATKPYLHVDELHRLLMRVLLYGDDLFNNTVLDCTGLDSVSILEVANDLKTEYSSEAPINWIESTNFHGDIRFVKARWENAAKKISWSPKLDSLNAICLRNYLRPY